MRRIPLKKMKKVGVMVSKAKRSLTTMSSPSEKRTCQELYEKKIKIQTFIPIKIEMEQTG